MLVLTHEVVRIGLIVRSKYVLLWGSAEEHPNGAATAAAAETSRATPAGASVW